MEESMIGDAVTAAGFHRERNPGPWLDAKAALAAAVRAAEQYAGAAWTPIAIHLNVDGSPRALKNAWLLHPSAFAYCELLTIPTVRFFSVRNPISLEVTRDDGAPSLAVTLQFADSRGGITLGAVDRPGVTQLEATIRDHLLPLFNAAG